jgi:DNA-binding PadR family transcriptional regulator
MKNKLYILLFLAFLFSGTTLWAQQKATPKAGEGISSFLLRHNRSPKKYYDDFIELNKQKLGKNNVLKVGVTYVIPPIKKSPSGNTGTKQQSPKAKSTKIGTNLKRASVEIILLSLLCEEPMYGYQLAQEIKKRSNGQFSLMEASMYPVLGRLKEQGDVTMETVQKTPKSKRVYYHITEMGRNHLAQMKQIFADTVGIINTIIQA